MQSIRVKLMTPGEVSRYEDIKRRFEARADPTREEFAWMMDNITRYDMTITVTQTSPL
jgi:hypothetical protein